MKSARINRRSRRWKAPLFYYFYIPFIMLFFYAPIITIIVFSFNSGSSLIRWESFSFHWYEELFKDAIIMEAVQTTVIVALLATLISTIIGTLGSIGIATFKRKAATNAVLNVNNLPVVTPDIVTAVALSVLFLGLGIRSGFGTMLMAHIAFCTPFVIISVYPKMAKMDKNLIEAAMDLGASSRKALVKVIVPELLPSILSGSIMAFTMSFDDFIISYFVGGTTMNISTYIYSNFKKVKPTVNALMTIIFIVLLALVLLSSFLRKSDRTDSTRRHTRGSVR